jgi:hypothetical protein
MKSFKQYLKENESQLMLRNDGHYDVHGLTPEHLSWLGSHPEVLAAKGPVTLTLPEHLPPLPVGIIGPSLGDNPVGEDQVHYANRGGGRPYESRMVHYGGPDKTTRMITAISRPHAETGKPFLITAFGGPLAPKEVNDPSHTEESRAEAQKFWSQHALIAKSDKENQR